jgi:hypothetical protein
VRGGLGDFDDDCVEATVFKGVLVFGEGMGAL